MMRLPNRHPLFTTASQTRHAPRLPTRAGKCWTGTEVAEMAKPFLAVATAVPARICGQKNYRVGEANKTQAEKAGRL
jgi:hypothetical protein